MAIRTPAGIAPMQGTMWGGPGGFRNFVIPCGAETSGGTITLNLPVYVDRFRFLLQQQTYGFIADADCVGDISVDAGDESGAIPVYLGATQASGSNISEGDYCQVSYDTNLGADGGFHLLNWTQLIPGGQVGNTVIETTAGPFTVADDTAVLILNKAVASATTVNLPTVADRNGLALIISDFGGNAGDITIDAFGAETIMGLTQAVLASTGQGVGSAASITLYPNEDLSGWYI